MCPRLPKKWCVECQRDPIKTFSLLHLHFGMLSQQVWFGVFVSSWLCDHGQVTCPIKVGQDHDFQYMKHKRKWNFTNVPCEETGSHIFLVCVTALTFVYIMNPHLTALHLKSQLYHWEIMRRKNKSYICHF